MGQGLLSAGLIGASGMKPGTTLNPFALLSKSTVAGQGLGVAGAVGGPLGAMASIAGMGGFNTQ